MHYDPLVAKLVAFAETREAAIARASAALRSFPVLGVRTNIPFLIRLLAHPEFQNARIDTGFVDAHRDALVHTAPAPIEASAAAAAAQMRTRTTLAPEGGRNPDPWDTLTGWGR